VYFYVKVKIQVQMKCAKNLTRRMLLWCTNNGSTYSRNEVR